MEAEKKMTFKIPKKPRPLEENISTLSAQEKLERAKKLAASFGKSLGTADSKDSKRVKSSNGIRHNTDRHSSKTSKTDTNSHSNNNERHSSKNHKSETNSHARSKEVQVEKKPSYLEKLAKLTDEQKLEIIKKISGSLGKKDDKISDAEKLDKIKKISETIGKGPPSKNDKNEKVNGSRLESPLTGKVDRDKFAGSVESLQKMKKELKAAEEKVIGSTITLLGKTDDGIKREVKHFDRTDAEKMRQALQDKAARIKAMMKEPEELKPRERKRKKETSEKNKASEDDRNEKNSSSLSDTKKSYNHSIEERISEKTVKEEKPVKKKMPPPPSMNFNDLLKIAQEKSKEPVKIEVKKPVKEEERLLTKKELKLQKEYQEFLEFKARQKLAEREERENAEIKKEKQSSSSLKSKSVSNLTTQSSVNSKSLTSKSTSNLSGKPLNSIQSSHGKPNSSSSSLKQNPYMTSKSGGRASPSMSNSTKSGGRASPSMSNSSKSGQKSSTQSKPFTKDFKMHSSDKNRNMSSDRNRNTEQSQVNKVKHSSSSSSSRREGMKKSYDNVGENVLVCGPSKTEKPVASNPFDRIYGEIKKNHPSRPAKRKFPDEYSESEDELDQDLDDFVVDYLSSDEEEEEEDEGYEDYSKHIRDIFGYDKRKFKYESDYDIANMEANFKDVMKEEARSARLGLQEDLEDIRREEEELKRKAAAKKKKYK